MIPINLSISGFLSYRDPVDLDFTTFDLACISGANGAGKSSLLDAITWSLFGQARKRDDSLINTQSKAAEVVFTFAYEGNVYRVKRASPRGKTSQLYFEIHQKDNNTELENPGTSSALSGSWKSLSERTLRDTQALIESTLSMDYETFINASFFLQGKADQFTQQRAGDRKRLLGSILGLEVWERYRQQATDMRRGVEEQISSLEARLDEINRELAEEAQRKSHLKELETQLKILSKSRAAREVALQQATQIAATLAEQRKLVETLKRQMEAGQRQLNDLKTRADLREQERAIYAGLIERAAEIEAAYQAWQQARSDLESWNEIAVQFQEQQKRRQPLLDEINAERARLQQEKSSLIEQQEQVTAMTAKLPELHQRIDQNLQATAAIEEQIARRAELDAQLQSARQLQAEAKAENPRLRSEMDELKARIDQLQQVEGAACPVCGQPLGPDERLSMIEDLNNQGKGMGDRFRANQTLMRESDETVSRLEAQIQQFNQFESELRGLAQNKAQLDEQVAQIEQQYTAWEDNGLPRLIEITSQLEKESFAQQSQELLAELDGELMTIGYDAAAHDAARQTEAKGRSADEEQRTLDKAQVSMTALDREIGELEGQIVAQGSETARQEAEHDHASIRLAAAEAQAPDLEAARSELFSLQEQEQRLRMEVGAARQRVLVLDEQKKRRTSFETQREALARSVGQYKQLERAFGKDGVPALLIEQALPQIEAKANDVLQRLSGGSMSVRFITQASYKDKRREDLRETLDIQISDAAGTRDYEMFSGGEAFRVNFAIRLALSEVLAQRAGARLQTLVIDEGFGSQDAQGRQRLIEAINLIQQDFAKVLVITHIDELKDAFPTRIEVEKTPTGSTLRVI
jgi:exonuclease SbcC